MKKVTYRRFQDGQPFTVEYDETAACRCCGEPVREASVGGTDLCPACDMGFRRSAKCPREAREVPR